MTDEGKAALAALEKKCTTSNEPFFLLQDTPETYSLVCHNVELNHIMAVCIKAMYEACKSGDLYKK